MHKHLSSEEIRRLDALALEKFGIPTLLLMEHASLNLCFQVEADNPERSTRIAILCGKGNNGGDGMAASRHLHNRGFKPEILLVGNLADIRADSDAQINAAIIQKMGIPLRECLTLQDVLSHLDRIEPVLVLDAVLGTGLVSEVRGLYRELFQALNERGGRVIAVDVPSGLNADTGQVMGAAIRAAKTVTFAFPKKGFLLHEGPRCCGEVIVAGIGLPREVMENPHWFLGPRQE